MEAGECLNVLKLFAAAHAHFDYLRAGFFGGARSKLAALSYGDATEKFGAPMSIEANGGVAPLNAEAAAAAAAADKQGLSKVRGRERPLESFQLH